MQPLKIDFAESLDQSRQIFVGAVASDIKHVRKSRLVLGALRMEDRADAVTYVDDFLDGESTPGGNLIAAVVRNREHTVGPACRTPDDRSIVKALPLQNAQFRAGLSSGHRKARRSSWRAIAV